NRGAPLLEIRIRQLPGCRKNTGLDGVRTVLKGSGKIELRQHGAIVPDVEVDEGRIQTEKEQAVADRERVVKNPITRSRDHIGPRLPGKADSRAEVIAIRVVE